MSRVYVSGIQPSGELHLGNYFGAMLQNLSLQNEEGEKFFFIANYHALTSVKNPEELARFSRQIAAAYVALGLTDGKARLFYQSFVTEVHELAWIFSCLINTGVLERAHAFKDKMQHGLQANVGLFTYPILMAADILIYKGTHVPVGKDQIQHIEIARDLAQAFNSTYNVDFFTKPEAYLGNAPIVPGTDGRKMSKSYKNTISIFESKNSIRKQVNSIVTDSKNPSLIALDPETCNAFAIFALLASPEEVAELKEKYLHDRKFLGYGVTKKLITEAHERLFGDSYDRYLKLLDRNNEELNEILYYSAVAAKQIAKKTLYECHSIIGIR